MPFFLSFSFPSFFWGTCHNPILNFFSCCQLFHRFLPETFLLDSLHSCTRLDGSLLDSQKPLEVTIPRFSLVLGPHSVGQVSWSRALSSSQLSLNHFFFDCSSCHQGTLLCLSFPVPKKRTLDLSRIQFKQNFDEGHELKLKICQNAQEKEVWHKIKELISLLISCDFSLVLTNYPPYRLD